MGVRFYQEGDEIRINALFQKVFKKERSLKHWKWKYQQHPHKENPWILVYEEDNRILGHIALWIADCYIAGEEHKAGLRIDTMVDPDARGKGIYNRLNQKMITLSRQSGILLLYGFPAPRAKQLLLNHTGAESAGDISRYVLILNPAVAAATKLPGLKPIFFLGEAYKKYLLRQRHVSWPSGWQVEHVTQCGDRFTELAEKTRTTKPILIKRSQSYLNWRYHDHPDINYSMTAISFKNTLYGYLVTKQEMRKVGYSNIKVGTIMDWLAVKDDVNQNFLLSTAVTQLQDCDLIQTWTTPGSEERMLKESGFKEKDKPSSLILHSSLAQTSKLEDWWLTQGDTDSF